MNINFKPNVIIVWTTTNIKIATAFCDACKEVLTNYIPTVTSGSEGTHSLDSGHYYGRALDFRSMDIKEGARPKVRDLVQILLGHDYLCLLEDDHFHIQRNKNTF